jgi:hypothetical protein
MDLVLDSQSAITLAFISIFFFYYLFFYRSSSKEAPIVQGAWPIVGHLPLLRPSNVPTHRILGELANKYGSLFSIKLGSKRAVVISNWEMAKECFTKFDLEISNRPNLEATQHMAYNGAMFVLAPHGSYWRQVQKITTVEIFSHRRMEQLQHFRVMVVRASMKNLFKVWCRKENKSSDYVPIELKQLFGEVSSNIVLPMLVGKRYFGATSVIDKEEADRCIKTLKEMLRLVGVFTVGDALPFLKWFDFGGHVKAMKKTSKEMDKILGDLLEDHRRNRKTSNEKDVDPSHQDFMDVMLSLLDGSSIEGFDCDTIIKATILVCIYVYIFLLPYYRCEISTIKIIFILKLVYN